MISLSRIVKAKWIAEKIETLEFDRDLPKNSAQNQNGSDSVPGEISEGQEAEAVYDHNIEAIKSANELMKSAVKSSQEIRLISKEKGYQEGFSQGYEAGFQQGIDEGTENVIAESEGGIKKMEDLIEEMKQERRIALETEEKDLLHIAFEIARKIMKQQVQLDENAILKMLEEIINDDEEGLKIYLSEYQKTLDIHVDKEITDKIKKMSKRSKVIILKDEDKIMVETTNGVVDMSLPVQLDQLEKAIDQSS